MNIFTKIVHKTKITRIRTQLCRCQFHYSFNHTRPNTAKWKMYSMKRMKNEANPFRFSNQILPWCGTKSRFCFLIMVPESPQYAVFEASLSQTQSIRQIMMQQVIKGVHCNLIVLKPRHQKRPQIVHGSCAGLVSVLALEAYDLRLPFLAMLLR